MSAHTPAPWRADDYGVRDVGGYICWIHKPHRYEGQDERYQKEVAERRADARLIAAAPDLLAACQGAIAAIDNYPDRQHPMTASEIILRAAIVKAVQP